MPRDTNTIDGSRDVAVSTSNTTDRLLTSAEAATYLGLDDHKAPSEAIRYLCRCRRVQHVKVGRGLRFRKAWLDAFIHENAVEPITTRTRR